MIHYQLESFFRLGETVNGRCEWLPSDQESGNAAKLTVGWLTEGRGDIDRADFYEAELNPHSLTGACSHRLERLPTGMKPIVFPFPTSRSPSVRHNRLGRGAYS